MPEVARIVTVCTGNVCRSPAMALLLDAALNTRGDVVVRSGGTRAHAGMPLAEPMAELLRGVGIEPGATFSRPLLSEDIASADLVLTATREHRTAVVRECPDAVLRTFTLRELARLAAHVPSGTLAGATAADRLRPLVQQAPRYRPLAPRGSTGDDIEDPWGRPPQTYRRVFDAIFTSTLEIVDALVR